MVWRLGFNGSKVDPDTCMSGLLQEGMEGVIALAESIHVEDVLLLGKVEVSGLELLPIPHMTIEAPDVPTL